MLGFSALESEIMHLAWAAGSWLSAGEICQLLKQRRPVAQSTAESALTALVRKGHLDRTSPDGTRLYHPVRPMAGHLAGVISRLLDHSPDPAATLALAGVVGSPRSQAVRIAVVYDGWWYQNAAGFFALQRGTALSLAGLHDAIRWHAAALFDCPVQHVAICHAHYVAGRDQAFSGRYDDELADCGIIRHDMPVTDAKGEVGADVELALTCYHLALEAGADMIALLAGDGDFAPLAARLAGRGTRVLVPVANFSYPRPGATTIVRTAEFLVRRATDTPDLADLLAAADGDDYPRFLARPFPSAAPAPRPGRHPRRRGTVTRWKPGLDYGFITGADGLSWFISARDTPRHARLPPGTPVTFTGDPSPPPGKSSPRARVILSDPGTAGETTVTPPGASCPSPAPFR